MALLVSVYHPGGWDAMLELLFLLVLVLSGVFGAYILLLILRSRHRRHT